MLFEPIWRIAIIVTLCLSPVKGTLAGAERPNVLWITCEDTSPDLGCYGLADAHTPNLDRLAAQGARFDRCFSVAGVCAPSRSCLITGMYPTTLGTCHMRIDLSPPKGVECFPAYLRRAGYYCTNNVKQDYNFKCPPDVWDDSSKSAHWKNRPAGKPFFAVVNLTVTHESQIRAAPAAFARQTRELAAHERHDPAASQLPPYYPDTPAVRHDWAKYRDLIVAMDKQAGKLLDELAKAGLAENTIVFFFGDHGRGLPRGKRWLYDSGIRVPLIVRWPGQLKPGSVDGRLVSFVDFAPTVLSLCGVDPPKHMQGQPFLGPKSAKPRDYIFAARDRMDETYDIVRAIRGPRYKLIVNLEPEKPYAQRLSYMDEMPTCKDMRRLFANGKLTGPQKHWFADRKPFLELYDTNRDPHEVDDLLAKTSETAIIDLAKSMYGELHRWMADAGDVGLLPETHLHQLHADSAWRETSKDGRPRYLHAAHVEALVNTRHAGLAFSTATAGHHAGLFADEKSALHLLVGSRKAKFPSAVESAIDYWRIVAWPNQVSAEFRKDRIRELENSLANPDPSIRLACALALLDLGRSEPAMPVIQTALACSDPWTQLLALNAICLRPQTRAKLRSAIEPLRQSANEYVRRKSKEALAD